jgi:ligand-binding sensor domain-containing protein
MDIFTDGTLLLNLVKRVPPVMRPVTSLLLALWLTVTGLAVNAQTYPFREYTTDDGLPQTQSLNIMQDSRGYLWIPTRNGLARFDGYTFISYYRRDGLPSNMVKKVIEDRQGTIWAVTINGLARFNGKSFDSYPVPDQFGVKQVDLTCMGDDTSSFFMHASIDFDNQFILLFKDGIYRNFSAENPALQGKKVVPVLVDADSSTLWLLDENHDVYSFCKGELELKGKGPFFDVIVVDGKPRFLTLEEVQASPPASFQWENGRITMYFKDRDGTVWAGTETTVYRLISEAFVIYGRPQGLPEETWALAADPRGGVWVGSITGELKYFDGKKFYDRKDYQSLYGRSTIFYRGSSTLSNGEIWFSTEEGILIWDGKRFRVPHIAPFNFQVCIIYEDPVDKSIFVGTDKGLFHIKGEKTDFYDQMSWPGYGIVEGIARDHSGNYWLAGHYGVVHFDGKNFEPFRPSPGPAEMAWGIICDYMGNIWSAGSDGLYICNPDDPVFNIALPVDINLPANVIRDLGDHRLLVGRMTDICIIDLDKYYAGQPDYYSILDRTRGFPGNDCQDNGIVKDTGGHWWILTNGSLIRFDPEKIERDTLPPMVHITRAEVPGDTADWDVVLDASLFYDTISFLNVKGRRNSIRISYTGISTRNPENVRFTYRMKGLTDNWSKSTDERNVVYTDIPPGNYTFEVQAINADGVKSVGSDIMEIDVDPTFMQSGYTIIAIIILTLSLIVILSMQIRRSVLERRIEEARRQAETYRLQLNSVIRQFDPHFTFNAVTSVGSLIMKGEKEKAYNYFIKLSNLLRSVITDSTLLLKPLEEELEFVTRYCELQQLRFGNRFGYEINVAPDVNLKTPVPKMIIQSFTENALKHGLENKKGHGLVVITVAGNASGLELKIRDNGIGRAAAARMNTGGSGTGLKNINGIVETINKVNREKITFTLTDLYDEGKAAGTEVRISLPHNYTFIFPEELNQ